MTAEAFGMDQESARVPLAGSTSAEGEGSTGDATRCLRCKGPLDPGEASVFTVCTPCFDRETQILNGDCRPRRSDTDSPCEWCKNLAVCICAPTNGAGHEQRDSALIVAATAARQCILGVMNGLVETGQHESAGYDILQRTYDNLTNALRRREGL